MCGSTPLSRRQFLTLMGASLALAGLAGCSRPATAGEDHARTFAQPEQLVPGKPLFFATAMTHAAAMRPACSSRATKGRPTKIEGNPDHPASRGATDIFAQASILTLYDPDRSQTRRLRAEIATWDDAAGGDSRRRPLASAEKRAAGLRILTETVISPTLTDQLDGIAQGSFPRRVGISTNRSRRRCPGRGRAAFGQPVQPHYRLDKADVIVSLDADFLAPPGNLHYVRRFAAARDVGAGTARAKKPT